MTTLTQLLTPISRLLRRATVAAALLVVCTVVSSQAQEATWQWAKSAGSIGKDAFTATSRDAAGANIFAAGRFTNTMLLGAGILTSAGGTDVVLARYHPTGAVIWAIRFGGVGNDAPSAVTVDPQGNVYVVGAFENKMGFGADTLTSVGGSDIFILKFTAGGDYLWSRRAGGPGNDVANAVALDPSGNVYVGGVFRDSVRFASLPWLYSAGGTDMCIAQYTPDGTAQWSLRAGGTGTDVLTAMAINTGGVYTTGSFTDTLTIGADVLASAGSSDIFIGKYNTSGTPQWARRAGGVGIDAAYALALDISGDVLIGGTTGDSAAFGSVLTGRFGGQDGVIARYTSAGNAQWARVMGGVGDDNVMGIAVDSAGATYVAGYFSQTASIAGRTLASAGGADVFAAKYSNAGAPIWSKRGGGEDQDYAYDITVDNSHASYICGSFYYEATYSFTVLGGRGDDDAFMTRLLDVVGNDVGVVDILFPQAPFAPGAADVKAVIQNFGTGIMDTVRIDWMFNDSVQTTRYSGKDLSPGQRDTITLGSPIFPEKLFSLVRAYTVLPNNAVDPNSANDEYAEAMGPGLLKGTYTLGGTTPDFATFAEATRYLNICGVLDTVFVNVRQGTYLEQAVFQQIPGVSATKRLTIRKQPGAANRPQINFTALYPNNNYALLLDGTDWVTIQGLAINALGGTYNRAVLLRNGTSGDILDSNAISSPAAASVDGCMMSEPANDCSGLSLVNNNFSGGVYGLRVKATAPVNVNVMSNRFTGYTLTGIEADRVNGSMIDHNFLTTTANATTGLLLSTIGGGAQITSNVVREIPSGTGIRIRNSSGSAVTPLLLANNMVQVGAGNVAARGIALDTCRFTNVYHNTVNQTSTAPAESGFAIRSGDSNNVVNNLFYNSGGGYAYSIAFATPTKPVLRSNYNGLYSAGPILGSYKYDTTTVLATDLAVWRAAPVSLDTNSVTKVVTFQNDLTHLTVVDTLLYGDAMLRSAITTDIDNQQRKTPYMGADEMIPLITITEQTPYRQILCLGSTAVFHVNANISNAGKIHYQWQINGIDIPDSTRSELIIYNVTRNSEAFFRCIITGNSGADTVFSDRIQLLVINGTEILSNPKTRYVLQGQTAEFEVLAEAAPPTGSNQVIYRWFRNGQLLTNSIRIAGATTSLLTIFNAQLSDVDSNYYAIVDGACGSDTSARFSLLMPGAAFDKQPKDTSVCGGDTVQITGGVKTGIPGQELRYEWQRNLVPLTEGTKYSGSATATLTIMGVTPADTGSNYRLKVVVVATGAVLFSDEVYVRLNAPTAITQAPIDALACEGKPHTFTVTASGVGLLYQWQRNDTNIAGANTVSYTIPSVTKALLGRYRVVVTGACGTVTSGVGNLTLKAQPFMLVQPPKTYVANLGKTLSLTINVGGSTPITYKWYHNGTLIPNQVANILILDSAKKSDEGLYWCIAENDCGTVKSDTSVVKVEPLGVAEGDAMQPLFGITGVHPNPVNGEASVQFTLGVSGSARLTLTDVYGREVMVISTAQREAGAHTVSFDATGLASGQYYCILTTPTGAVSMPVTIIR